MKFFQTDTTAKILFVLYIILFVVCAINPYDRADWWAENVPISAIAIALAVMYAKGIKFSPLSYILMSVLLFMHTIGGHYTFERVPFGFVTNLFGFERNHYDRVAHFTVGFYAYAIAELLYMKQLVKNKIMLFLFPVFAIGFVAMGYELIEWIFAVTNGGSAGIAFLGSQGDIWDAQKDMLADTLGAIFAASLFLWKFRKIKLS
jgi:putative membrane protein